VIFGAATNLDKTAAHKILNRPTDGDATDPESRDEAVIVDVTRNYRREGMAIREAVTLACRVRLRPILMTSLATILGLIPMALALEAGSEQYAPLARSIIGGLTVSVVLTVFLVPAAYLLIHRKEERPATEVQA
jgi:Cu/Ag efflux pump CusA